MNRKWVIFGIVLLATVLLVAATQVPTETAEDDFATGQAALRAGEPATALEHLHRAAQTSPDPGLVAFYRGQAHYALGQFRQAALAFQQCYEDSEAPAARHRLAQYNRGVCWLRRGGLAEYAAAVADFNACLTHTNDEAFQADVRYNLELAKILWYEAWQEERRKPQPVAEPPQNNLTENNPPPVPPPPLQPPEPLPTPAGTDGTGSNNAQVLVPIGEPLGPGADPADTLERQAGAGALPLKFRGEDLPTLSDSELSVYFEQLQERILRERKNTQTMTPRRSRPTVKDW